MRQNVQFRFGGPLTPVVKKLMIINGAVFLLQLFSGAFFPGLQLEQVFGISHQGLVNEFKIWQPFTYMFLHGGFFHILMNLFALWMFSGDLEELWGSSAFMSFYLISGVGAGLFIALMNFFACQEYGVCSVPTLGASGAIYALLLAYGLTWPNREVLLYFIIPIKMKYLVLIFGLIEFFGTFSGGAPGATQMSHVGHLGGIVSGLLLFLYRRNRGSSSKTAGAQKPGLIAGWLRRRRLKKKQEEINQRIEAKEIIDALLTKIARGGMKSLTPQEKKQLDWARKHYYPDNTETFH